MPPKPKSSNDFNPDTFISEEKHTQDITELTKRISILEGKIGNSINLGKNMSKALKESADFIRELETFLINCHKDRKSDFKQAFAETLEEILNLERENVLNTLVLTIYLKFI